MRYYCDICLSFQIYLLYKHKRNEGVVFLIGNSWKIGFLLSLYRTDLWYTNKVSSVSFRPKSENENSWGRLRTCLVHTSNRVYRYSMKSLIWILEHEDSETNYILPSMDHARKIYQPFLIYGKLVLLLGGRDLTLSG